MSMKGVKDTSQEAMQKILDRLGKDVDFRRKFTSDPIAIIDKDYPKMLNDDQRTLLRQIAEGFASDKKTPRVSLPPTSFKEAAAAFLSVILMLLFLYVIWQTYAMIPSPPQAVKIGDTIQVFDSFSRAKDTLNILFPLFAAVVTFWLGVAVESKRGDQLKDAADNESKNRTNAENRESRTKARAAGVLGFARGQLEGGRKGDRSVAGGSAQLQGLIDVLSKAEKDITES